MNKGGGWEQKNEWNTSTLCKTSIHCAISRSDARRTVCTTQAVKTQFSSAITSQSRTFGDPTRWRQQFPLYCWYKSTQVNRILPGKLVHSVMLAICTWPVLGTPSILNEGFLDFPPSHQECARTVPQMTSRSLPFTSIQSNLSDDIRV
jgi:hypothetical protein